MHVHKIMDRSGDTRHEFDPADATAIEAAEKRFMELTGAGFKAVAMKPEGNEFISKFDPTVEQTLFIPQLQGG